MTKTGTSSNEELTISDSWKINFLRNYEVINFPAISTCSQVPTAFL